MERRAVQFDLAPATEASPRTLRGLAVVYDQPATFKTKNGSVVHERVRPGALSRTLRDGHEIHARFEHEDLLATTANGTLRLTDTPDGLQVEIDVAETRAGDDVLALVRRGDIRGMSFGFLPAANGQKWTRSDGHANRDLIDIDLFEVTVTDSPFYTGTSIQARSVDQAVMDEAERMLSVPSLTDRRMKLRRLIAAV